MQPQTLLMPSVMPWEAGEELEPQGYLELRADLASTARHLTAHERRLLRLLVQGLSHREIADHFGIGWKSVGARVQRLRGKLRLLLERPPKGR